MKKQFIIHEDGCHGWLEVSYKDITDLNIQNEISDYSYINRTTKKIFLEEDCDATLFLNEFERFLLVAKILRADCARLRGQRILERVLKRRPFFTLS